MVRMLSAERWPSRYFTNYRPDENDAPVTQAAVVELLSGIDDVDRPLIIENIADDQDPGRIAAEFGTTANMAAALVEHVRAGGK